MSAQTINITGGEITEASGPRTYEVTIIKAGPGNAVNGHWYPAEMLEAEAAAGKFDGRHIYADHENDPMAQRKRGGVRSTKDLVGVIQEAWWDAKEQAVVGKAVFVRDWVAEILEADISLLGLSIRATAGKISKGRFGGAIRNVVESIADVASVDLVTRAGAGGKINRIIESMQEDTMALEAITIDDIKEHRSDLVEALVAEATAGAPETITVEEHEAKLAEAKAEAREAAIKETEERIEKERKSDDLKRENTAMVESEIAEAELPARSAERLKRDFDAKISAGDTPTDELREALQSAIKETKLELAEAVGSGEIKGMGGGPSDLSESGEGAKAPSLAIHNRVLGAIAPDIAE